MGLAANATMFFHSYISNIEKGFPLTHYPKTIPKVQDKIVSRDILAWLGNDPVLRVALGPKKKQHAHGDSLVFIQNWVNWFFANYKDPVVIPINTLTVSIASENFGVGNSCQEFYPTDRKMPEDAFFTYRMLSKYCQATYYNEGGVYHLAGMCYYLQLYWSFIVTTLLDDAVMKCAVVTNIPYPLVDRWKVPTFKQLRYYGRDCKTAGKRVQVYLAEGKDPVHQIVNLRTFKFEYIECEECKEDAKTYKFVPAVKKVEEKKAVKPATVAPKEEVKKEEPAVVEEKPKVEEKRRLLMTATTTSPKI